IGTQLNNTNIACADFLNNNSTGNVANGGVDYRLRQRQSTTVRLPGYTNNNTNTVHVNALILARPNPAAGSGTVAAAVNSPPGGGFVNTVPAGSPCAQPTVPTAPITFDSTSESQAKVEGSTNGNATSPTVSEAAKPAHVKVTAVSNGPSFFKRTLAAVASFAGALSSMVMPTAHAAEITAPTEAADRASEDTQPRAKVMSNHAVPSRASKSEDRTQKAQVATTSAALTAPMSGETVTANIGALPAGGSVTIKFDVTVNDPPNLSLLNPPRVSNQGTVTGSNFATVSTDDPTVGGGSDATVTLIDLFNTTTSLNSNLNPANVGDQVTFTATVSENPPQGSADPGGTVDFIDTSNGNAVICNDVALSSGSAQCQVSSLTAGIHNIRADYSGDGNFDPSQSNVVAQVLNACTPNPVVTSTADNGAGTLREALANLCTGNTITFNIAGPGPHTITLTTGELVVAKDVTINNNSGESISVNGNNASRVFSINSGKTAAIIGLTVSGGQTSGNGGGILNDGTLTVVNSTVTGNNAATDGGGIT